MNYECLYCVCIITVNDFNVSFLIRDPKLWNHCIYWALESMCVQVLHCEIQRERRICSMGIQGFHSETSHNWNALCGQHVRVFYLYLARRSEGKMECICVPENSWIRFVYSPWSLTQMFCLVCIAEQIYISIWYYR